MNIFNKRPRELANTESIKNPAIIPATEDELFALQSDIDKLKQGVFDKEGVTGEPLDKIISIIGKIDDPEELYAVEHSIKDANSKSVLFNTGGKDAILSEIQHQKIVLGITEEPEEELAAA
jgi:hypothetical protein